MRSTVPLPPVQPPVGFYGGGGGGGVGPPSPCVGIAAMATKQHRTLDLEHSSVLKRLGRERAHAEELRCEAARLDERIARMECMPRTDLTDEDFEDLKRTRYRHDRVMSDADDASQRGDEIDYFVRTGGILFKYYDIIDKGAAAAGSAVPHNPQRALPQADGPLLSPPPQTTTASSSGMPSTATAPASSMMPSAGRSILSYFTSAPAQKMPTHAPAAQQQSKAAATTTTTTTTHAPVVQADDRATLFDRYLQSVDGNNPVCYGGGAASAQRLRLQQQQLQQVPQQLLQQQQQAALNDSGGRPALGVCGFCGGCDRAMQLHEGYIFCRSCQTVEYVLVDHEKPSYKDPPKEVAYFAYKRINHFNEWLNQVQGKETTDIPEEVYDVILLEIKKQKLTNMATLTRKNIKDILKKLRINKYYEHVPHIINRLNGMPSPHLSPELEDRLRHMFCQIQVPFLKHAPPCRKNFLSYSFCLNKMMQLLEKDQYLESFPLLKSREKLHQQDMIWQKICAEIGWDFIPSL